MSKSIATILTLTDKFSPKIVGISAKVAGMSKEMQRASMQSVNMTNKMNKSLMATTDKVVKAGLKWAALTAVAAAGIVFKVGIDGLKELDNVAAKIKSISTGVTANKSNVEAGLLSTSNKTGISVQDIGTTQYDAVSSGVSEKNSLAAAVVAAKLAKAGFTDADSSLKVLMSTMNVYGLTGTKAMTNIADKMLVVQNLGVITVAEMAESMGSVTPVAQAAGASIDELDAGMISLTKNGVKADEASVQMKGIFTSIIKPSKQAATEAKNLGLSFNAATLKSEGFSKFMADVKTKTGGSTEKMAKLFGNVRALTGALVLSGPGFDDFNAGLLALKKSGGLTASAYATMTNTIGAKSDKLSNLFKNTCTKIVATQSGAMGKIADNMIAWLNSNQGNIQVWVNKVGLAIQGILSKIGAIVTFVIAHRVAISNFALAFASFYVAIKIVLALRAAFVVLKTMIAITNGVMLVSPWAWAVLAIAAVIFICVKLYQHWDLVKLKAQQLWTAIQNNPFVQFVIACNPVLATLQFIINHFNDIIKAIKGAYDWLKAWNDTPADNKTSSVTTTSLSNGVKVPKKVIKPISMYGYANGGVATKASIFGEAGAEIAIPLNSSARSKSLVDKADQLVNGKKKNDVYVAINIAGNVIGNEDYADYVGTHVVKQVKLALSNMP